MAPAELKLQIVVTLAGQSMRFKDRGISTPKPMISVAGKPMVSYALDSIAQLLPSPKLIGIVCRQDQITNDIKNIFSEFSIGSRIIEIPGRTAGPVQTILQAEANLDPASPLLILDCDLHFHSKEFLVCLQSPGNHLLSFESNNPGFSYVQEDQSHKVIRIAEKQVISTSALIGAYHFQKAENFLSSARKRVNAQPLKECFVSNVIGDLLAKGIEFFKTNADLHLSFGTPDELAQSERALMRINP